MSVYLVTRSHYVGPTGKKIQKFEDETVLSWFQSRWTDSRAETESDLGYFFRDLGEEEEEEIPSPESDDELAALLEEHLYAEGGILFAPHCVQILHDDDELQFAFYLFDDYFLAANRDKATFLLQDELVLPTTAGNHSYHPETETTLLEPIGNGEGVTYLVFLAYYESVNLLDLDGYYRLEGVRIPQLVSYLRNVPNNLDGKAWPFELQALRELALLAEEPLGLESLLSLTGSMPFDTLYQRFSTTVYLKNDIPQAKQELRTAMEQLYRGEMEPVEPLSEVLSGTHQTQLVLFTGTCRKGKLFHRWIFFDDVWLAANRKLGEAILNYAARWDVLS